MRLVTSLLVLAFAASAHAAPDLKLGKTLHDKHCDACHVRLFDGDGSKIYTRPDRLVKSLSGLRQRVAYCAMQTGSKWFPDDEDSVTAYLNQQFYKFK